MNPKRLIPSLFVLTLLAAAPLAAQNREVAIVDSSGRVLDEIMAIPAKGIPESLLADAQGIVIVPDLLKGSFIVGVRHGRGVVMVRDDQGAWRPPVFVTVTGGSVGWQIGLQATDIIMVFKTRSSVNGLLTGKFTLGADAAVAAGPVGREAAAATDVAMKAEIYTYSRSRGLFAGVSLDGSIVQTDSASSALYYANTNVLAPGNAAPAPFPPSAAKLLDTLAKYTAPPTPAAGQPGAVAAQPTPADARQQAVASYQRLVPLLDNNWRAYLSLPPEIYATDRQPTAESVRLALNRFETVARDPRYQSLTQKAEFREAHQLLLKYSELQIAARLPALPPPPPR